MSRSPEPAPSEYMPPAPLAYLQSVTGGRYGAPLPRDAPGYDFDIERSRRGSLEWPASIQGWHIDVRRRLCGDYLEIRPEAERDEHIARALATPIIKEFFEKLSACATRTDFPLGQGHDDWSIPAGKDIWTTEWTRTFEQQIAERAVLFLSTFRDHLHEEAGMPEAHDTGFGSCICHGPRPIANPEADDRQDHRPDIPVLSKYYTGSVRIPISWADVVSFIEVKLCPSFDLSKELTEQVLRYVRCIKHAHPLCSTVHGVTLCGHKLRLWRFGPETFSTSRLYSLKDAADMLPIARIFAFLCAAKPTTLLGQWSPPPTFRVQSASGRPQTWTWTEGSPQVVFVRPETFGSHTAIFGGRAESKDGSNDGAKSGDGWMTFVKCVIIPRCHFGHELKMQRALQHLPRTPLPLGVVDTGDFCRPPSQKAGLNAQDEASFPLGPYCLGRDDEKTLAVHAFAYRHRLGEAIPDSMSERELCSLSMQLGEELYSYSRAHAHYRDLNFGNVLFERTDGGVRLILVDHGNVRLGMQKRGEAEQVLEAGNDTEPTAARLKHFIAIALDDIHAVTKAFMPSGAQYVEDALIDLRDAERHKQGSTSGSPSKEQETGEAAILATEEISDSSWDFDDIERFGDAAVMSSDEDELEDAYEVRDPPALTLRLYSHTYIDDLESLLYMLLVTGANRSFSGSDRRLDTLHRLLHNSRQKRRYWESPLLWKGGVDEFCPSMSGAWREMLVELRGVIFSAQSKRRARLRQRLGATAESLPPLDEEETLTSREGRCFISFLKTLLKHRHLLRTEEFSEEDFQPEEDPGGRALDPDVLYRTPPVSDWYAHDMVEWPRLFRRM